MYLDGSGCCNEGHEECSTVSVKTSRHKCTITKENIHSWCHPQIKDELNGVCYSCLKKAVCSKCRYMQFLLGQMQFLLSYMHFLLLNAAKGTSIR